MNHFTDADALTHYADTARRMVPGLADLRKMTSILLAEHVPSDGRVLVLGAGGGLETRVFAEEHPGWRFDGVDPSAEMLAMARQTLGPLMSRVALHQGLIDSAPEGPFHGATSLLTLHFVPREERLRTLEEVRRRLEPGAPLVVAHMSIPGEPDERQAFLRRYAAFAAASGVPPEHAENARVNVEARLPLLTPEEDEALLGAAGFSKVTLFYVGFVMR